MSGLPLALAYLLAAAVSTALASAAHGGNYARKGWVVALHMLAAPLAAPLFWGVLRRGKQARAELDVIAGIGTLAAVRRAYPLGLGHLVAWAIRGCTTRRQQELRGGFVLGLVLGVATLPVAVALAEYL